MSYFGTAELGRWEKKARHAGDSQPRREVGREVRSVELRC